MNTVLIPAAGSNTRWGRPYPKQMAQIGSESIIQRLIRQVNEKNSTPIVLAHNDLLIQHLPLETAIFNPARHRWLAETLISSQTYWHGRVLVLLGDVVVHPRLFNWMWSEGRPLQFYGTPHEIFAVSFCRTWYGRISSALHTALDYAERHPEDSGAGKLWSGYKALTGQPQALEVGVIDRHFTFVQDEYTRDIDTVNQYELFLDEVVAQGMLDEVMA